jgi:hypothetical protein
VSERRCEVTELLVDHCGRPFDEGTQLVRSDEVDGYCLLDHTVPRSIDR